MANSTSTTNQSSDRKYGSNSSTTSGSNSTTHTSTTGGSESTTVSQSNTKASSKGGSTTTSAGKSYASGIVSDKTQSQFDRFGNDYMQSDNVNNAYDNLQAALNGKPTFQSKYEDKLSNLYDQIMNRDKFSYNFNEDAMYQMYKDQYTQAGRNAMQDTMGQASALTGGYGSSYAQTAGQQTYQNYLTELNNMIPTLRDQAYQEYQSEGNELLNKYNITNNAYNNEYGQYRDSVADWQNDRSFDYGMYSDERNFDYNQYSDNRNYWQNEYWNEKNAEQSNVQASEENNWNESQSQTNSWSQTNSNYWEDSTSTTNTSAWSNTANTGWENNNSTSNTSAMSGGSRGGSGASGGSSVRWVDNGTMSYDNRNGTVKEAAKLYDAYSSAMNTDGTSKKEIAEAKKDLTDFYQDLLDYGTVNERGQKVTLDAEDIASIYRSMLSRKKDGGTQSYTTNEIINLLGLKV